MRIFKSNGPPKNTKTWKLTKEELPLKDGDYWVYDEKEKRTYLCPFWITEENSSGEFMGAYDTPLCWFDWLLNGLDILNEALEEKYKPYPFIPESIK